jgi:hypothetical protein
LSTSVEFISNTTFFSSSIPFGSLFLLFPLLRLSTCFYFLLFYLFFYIIYTILHYCFKSVWWCRPVVSALREAEAAGSLELRTSRLAWNHSEIQSQNENKKPMEEEFL